MHRPREHLDVEVDGFFADWSVSATPDQDCDVDGRLLRKGKDAPECGEWRLADRWMDLARPRDASECGEHLDECDSRFFVGVPLRSPAHRTDAGF